MNSPVLPRSYRIIVLAATLLLTASMLSPAASAAFAGSAVNTIVGWRDPQGEFCDYYTMTGPLAQFTSDIVTGVPKRLRIVFMDRDGDLIVVRFTGAGLLVVSLAETTALAPPRNHEYFDTFTQYETVAGHASLIVTNADATTTLSVYSIGTATTNDRIRPKPGATYEGIADLSRVTIVATTTLEYPIGALSLGNVRFSGNNGFVGIAAGVAIPASVSLHDIKASGTAVPGLRFGSGIEVAVNGGDLVQPNESAVLMNPGMTLRFQEGSTSDGTRLPAVPYTLPVASQPMDISVVAEQKAYFSAASRSASDNSTGYQWKRNGSDLANATNSILAIATATPASTGHYTARITDNSGSTTCQPAILGLTIPGKLSGANEEVGSNISHQNGRIFDQMLLKGGSASLRADPGQITRLSYIDLTDDIVQVEFSGAGTLTLTLEPGSTGPAAPANYNQAVGYMRGHARIVVAGADETTNLSVFSVGRLTAWDPTGVFDFLRPSSATNDPARNGSPLFKGNVNYDGFADLASISILSANGKFGGLRTSNASYYATTGLTGVYAPGVTFAGPVLIGDISAANSAEPVIRLGSASDVRITGGDLLQLNSSAVSVSGFTRLRFSAGQNSHGVLLAPQTIRGSLVTTGGAAVEVVKDPQ